MELYVFYILSIRFKIRINQMLFTILSINFLFIILDYKNLKFRHLINDIIFNS